MAKLRLKTTALLNEAYPQSSEALNFRTSDDNLSPKFPGWACARKSHQSGQAGTNSAHFGDTGQRTAKISLSARTFLATSKMAALEEQTSRQASIAADNILALLDTDSDKGIVMLRSSSPLTAAIVSSYLEDLPESFRIFNPALVARLERVRAKFQK
jgi:hypothetical protein